MLGAQLKKKTVSASGRNGYSDTAEDAGENAGNHPDWNLKADKVIPVK
jgi:hypothetical protein